MPYPVHTLTIARTRVEDILATYDDEKGFLRRWFGDHRAIEALRQYLSLHSGDYLDLHHLLGSCYHHRNGSDDSYPINPAHASTRALRQILQTAVPPDLPTIDKGRLFRFLHSFFVSPESRRYFDMCMGFLFSNEAPFQGTISERVASLGSYHTLRPAPTPPIPMFHVISYPSRPPIHDSFYQHLRIRHLVKSLSGRSYDTIQTQPFKGFYAESTDNFLESSENFLLYLLEKRDALPSEDERNLFFQNLFPEQNLDSRSWTKCAAITFFVNTLELEDDNWIFRDAALYPLLSRSPVILLCYFSERVGSRRDLSEKWPIELNPVTPEQYGDLRRLLEHGESALTGSETERELFFKNLPDITKAQRMMRTANFSEESIHQISKVLLDGNWDTWGRFLFVKHAHGYQESLLAATKKGSEETAVYLETLPKRFEMLQTYRKSITVTPHMIMELADPSIPIADLNKRYEKDMERINRRNQEAALHCKSMFASISKRGLNPAGPSVPAVDTESPSISH